MWMWELDYKESWALKNWCFWNAVLEKTLESPLDCKEIQPVHPKGDQSWVFIGRTDAEDETPILWPPDAKSWLIGKDPDAGKGWRQEEQGTAEDQMVGWHHWLNGHGFGWTPGVGDGERGLVCCDPWGRKESDTTEWLNWTHLLYFTQLCGFFQSLSRIRLFATPWIAAHQASLSITSSRSLLKLRSIESVMPSSHLFLCHPLLLVPFPASGYFLMSQVCGFKC